MYLLCIYYVFTMYLLCIYYVFTLTQVALQEWSGQYFSSLYEKRTPAAAAPPGLATAGGGSVVDPVRSRVGMQDAGDRNLFNRHVDILLKNGAVPPTLNPGPVTPYPSRMAYCLRVVVHRRGRTECDRPPVPDAVNGRRGKT